MPPVCASSQDHFRDVHDRLARVNAQIETIRDTIGTGALPCFRFRRAGRL